MNKYTALYPLSIYGLFAGLHFLLHWNGLAPYVFLGSDAGNIASFAAGWEFPQLFGRDNILADLDKLRYYYNIHVPLLRFLRPLFGDFGTASCFLMPFHVIVHAFGFYLLGRMIFENQTHAVLLGLVSLIPVVINLGTWWGIHGNALPRTSFQAILPYLLAFGMRYRNTPSRWPALMGFAGLAVYFHAPGTLVWAPALWLGFWGFLPAQWNWPRRLGVLLLLGLLFLVIFLPFAVNYLGTRQAAVDPAVMDAAWSIFRQRLSPGFLNVGEALAGFLSPAMLGLLAAAAAAAVLIHLKVPEDRSKLRLFALWTLGIFLTSVAVPLLDQTVAHLRGAFPVQIDLIRGLRFFIPLSLVLLVWGVVRLTEARQRLKPFGVALLCIVVLAGFGEFLVKSTKDLRHGHILSFSPEKRDYLDMLNAVMDYVPEGGTILPVEFNPLPVRYYALRPVIHAWKDGGHLGMTDPQRLLAWWDNQQKLQAVQSLENPEQRYHALLNLADSIKADYLLIDGSFLAGVTQLTPAHLEFRNDSYALLRMGR